MSPPLTPFLNTAFIKMDGVFPLFGTALFALFCFYLMGALLSFRRKPCQSGRSTRCCGRHLGYHCQDWRRASACVSWLGQVFRRPGCRRKGEAFCVSAVMPCLLA